MLSSTDSLPVTFTTEIVSARPALQRHALRLTKDHTAAEDLVQDTLMRAWRARTRFQGGTSMNAWLFRIARNAFLSGVRRGRRQVAWNPDRHQLMLVHAPTQDEALYARDLRSAMSRLSSNQLKALVLVTHEGMSMADAAEALGVPEGTVKSRVARARVSLLAFVGGESPSVDGPVGCRPDDSMVVVTGSDDADAPGSPNRARYEAWKASGATTIG